MPGGIKACVNRQSMKPHSAAKDEFFKVLKEGCIYLRRIISNFDVFHNKKGFYGLSCLKNFLISLIQVIFGFFDWIEPSFGVYLELGIKRGALRGKPWGAFFLSHFILCIDTSIH